MHTNKMSVSSLAGMEDRIEGGRTAEQKGTHTSLRVSPHKLYRQTRSGFAVESQFQSPELSPRHILPPHKSGLTKFDKNAASVSAWFSRGHRADSHASGHLGTDINTGRGSLQDSFTSLQIGCGRRAKYAKFIRFGGIEGYRGRDGPIEHWNLPTANTTGLRTEARTATARWTCGGGKS